MPNIIFTTFSTTDLESARESICADAQRLNIFDKILPRNDVWIRGTPEFLTLSKEVCIGRGFGHFWWKPFIIRKALELCEPNGLVFYSDCGRYGGAFHLGNGAKHLIQSHLEKGFAGVEVPQFGPTYLWTKGDCLHALAADMPVVQSMPQIQATFSLWRNTLDTQRFIREWELACRSPDLVSDTPSRLLNHPKFIAHRHDQSILTLLARRYNIPYLAPIRRLEQGLSQLLVKTYEANVGFKQTDFVYRCLQSRAAVPVLLAAYIRRKLLGRT